MTSPITAFAPPMSKVGEQEPISATVSGLLTFNKAGQTVQTSPKNPAATDATVANVFLVTVPPGARFLDLMTLSPTGTLATWPTVRPFGKLPPIDPAVGDTPPLRPGIASSTYAALADNAWRPLSDLSSPPQWSRVIGTGAFWSDGTFDLSEAVTFNVLGLPQVAVLISGAADQACMVVGNFGK